MGRESVQTERQEPGKVAEKGHDRRTGRKPKIEANGSVEITGPI